VLTRYHELVTDNIDRINKVERSSDPSGFAPDYEPPLRDLQNRTLLTALTARNKKLPFIIDEASVLLDAESYGVHGRVAQSFEVFRRALHCMPKEFPVMTILVDSNLAVTKPAPKQVYGSDARSCLYSETLLPPFYVLPLSVPGIVTGTDRAAFRASFQAGLPGQSLTLQHNPLQLAMMSRPLFAAYMVDLLQVIAEKASLGLTANFVQRKLLQDYALSQEEDTSKRRLQLCAIACARLWLLPAARETREAMVHRHLALCSGISEDRTRLIVQYKSEPIIAEAAMRTVLSDQIFLEMLQEVSSHLRAGTVLTSSGVGDTGDHHDACQRHGHCQIRSSPPHPMHVPVEAVRSTHH
jgi:hypothetical protein